MEKLKVDVYVVDKHNILPTKGVYLRENRLIEIRKGLRKLVSERFLANPDDIYILKKGRKIKYVCFVDNAQRKTISVEKVKEVWEKKNGKLEKKTENVTENIEVGEAVQIHSDDELDAKIKLMLDYLNKEAFYKSIMARQKIPTLQIIIFLIAGIGIYTILVTVLRACGINV